MQKQQYTWTFLIITFIITICNVHSKDIICNFNNNKINDSIILSPSTQKIIIDDQLGNYTIYLSPTSNLNMLYSSSYRILHNNIWYDNTNNGKYKLNLQNVTTIINKNNNNIEIFDYHKKISLYWTWGTNKNNVWITSFQCYNNQKLLPNVFITFEQYFPYGLTHDTYINDQRDIDIPSTIFPSFRVIETSTTTTTNVNNNHVHVATFLGQNAAKSTLYGKWPDAYKGGYLGGPVALFGKEDENSSNNNKIDNVIIMSTLTHHMVGMSNIIKDNNQVNLLGFGVGGLIENIPRNYTIEFVLSTTSLKKTKQILENTEITNQHIGRIAQSFSQWGDILIQKSYGKNQRTLPNSNVWISKLGYSTTGIYHYNPCDCVNNSIGWGCPPSSGKDNNCHTYQDNLYLIHQDAIEKKIPYNWFLIDSWWHAYNNHGDNEPYSLYFEDIPKQVGLIFPETLKTFQKKLGIEFGAHWSSSFSSKTPYRQLGGKWVCDNDNVQCIPIPNKQNLLANNNNNNSETNPAFDHIFQSNNEWSMSVLKMDHVLDVVLGGDASVPNCGGTECKPGERNRSIAKNSILDMVTDVNVAEQYLDGLGTSAYKNNVSIMLCMSFPNVLMHSVNHIAMTHGRGSTDSHLRHNLHGFPFDNWKGFGGESTLLWSLGLWPFKDTFYSNSSSRVKNSFAEDYGGYESLPFTQALVSALSGGGFAPGGPIGDADRVLLMMSCNENGKLLKPSIPAMYIDRVWLGDTSVGETSVAMTVINNDYVWRYVSIINNTEFKLSPNDVGILRTTSSTNSTNKYELKNHHGKYVAYFWSGDRPFQQTNEMSLLPFNDDKDSLSILSANWKEPLGTEATYVLIAPILNGNWILLGEANKFIPVSNSRIMKLISNSTDLILLLSGKENETINMQVKIPESMKIIHAQCVVPSSAGKSYSRKKDDGEQEIIISMQIKINGSVLCRGKEFWRERV